MVMGRLGFECELAACLFGSSPIKYRSGDIEFLRGEVGTLDIRQVDSPSL